MNLHASFCTPGNSKIRLSNAHTIAIHETYPVTPGHCLIVSALINRICTLTK